MALITKNIKGVADIVFCVDSTGSMQPCIDGLKSQLHQFIKGLEAPPEQGLLPVDWRMRVLGFRDLHHDDEPWVNSDSPMVGTGGEARAQIDSLDAMGGGDEPESALDALWLAAHETPWRDKAHKILVFFSDATSHERLHPDTVASGAPHDDVDGVAQEITTRNCKLHAWAPTCGVWDSLSKLPGVVFTPCGSGGDGLASLDFTQLIENLRRTVSMSATQGIGGDRTVPIP